MVDTLFCENFFVMFFLRSGLKRGVVCGTGFGNETKEYPSDDKYGFTSDLNYKFQILGSVVNPLRWSWLLPDGFFICL